MDLFKVYHLFKKKALYPGLIPLIDAVFMDVLEKKGIISREQIYDQAAQELRKDGLLDSDENLRTYVEALTDYHISKHLSYGEIENYINLARKKEKS
jgi:hypothetical protein